MKRHAEGVGTHPSTDPGPRSTPMLGRFVRLAVVALGVGSVVGASIGPGEVHACSCQIPNLATDLERAEVIVSGSAADFREELSGERRFHRRWLVEVDERYRGATPDVIEIVLDTEESSCADTRVSLPQVLLLDHRGDGTYDLPECISMPTEHDLVPFFEAPWPAVADGPPVVIGSATTGDHNLALLDEIGDVVGYLPGDGRTIGLSNCPGDEYFVQLRTASGRTQVTDRWMGVELVRWRFADLVPEQVIELDGSITEMLDGFRAIPVNCRGSDGNDVGIDAAAVLDGEQISGVEYVGGSFLASEHVFDQVAAFGRVIVLGPGELAFVPSEGVIRPPLVDGDNQSGPDIAVDLPDGVPEFAGWDRYQSVRPTATGWEVTVRQYGDDVDTFFVVDVTADGSAFLVDRAAGSTSARGPAIVIAPSTRDDLTQLGSRSAGPMFERTGTRIDAQRPIWPRVPESASEESAADVISEPVESTAPELGTADAVDDAAAWPQWVAGGMFVLLVLGGVTLAARRRGNS